MKDSLELLGYYEIIEQLQAHALTKQAKARCKTLIPSIIELELRKQIRETSQARALLDLIGTPPFPVMEQVEESLERALRGELLTPMQIGGMGEFLVAVRRLQSYLDKGKERQIGLAFYGENLTLLDHLRSEIERCIRVDVIDDYASPSLREIRRQILLLEDKIREKAERILKANQAYVNDSFIVTRNGRLCIPVKAEYKGKIQGSVIEKSSTGSTLFMEPQAVAALQEEYECYKIEEDTEERRILYELMEQIAIEEHGLKENIRVVIMLDVIFAKGKLSQVMEAVEPTINLNRQIRLIQARHPMIEKESCIPLDFTIGGNTRGVVITGPNTGGKTVALKTVALLSAMACAGLHIPCKEGEIALNSQILCDIGDGQDMSSNLSTFSAHIEQVIQILQRVDQDSLVIMDELGSGTDPAEGMGIAIAILEQLRNSGCLFLVTTHYPEIKTYANRHLEVVNARMGFDRENLRPLYRLEIGKAGDSCALYIAKRLGLPEDMLMIAAKEAYGIHGEELIQELELDGSKNQLQKVKMPKIQRKVEAQTPVLNTMFSRGDSVQVLSRGEIGIVVRGADPNGNVLVQVKKEKIMINYKRLELKVAAAELYPEDYDFSIVFDTVETRKSRHQMGKHHVQGLAIVVEE